MVSVLLAAGSDPNATNYADQTAFEAVIHGGKEGSSAKGRDCFDALIAAGADVDLVKNGWTPLFHAVFNSEPELVSCLLENGASIEIVDGKGNTALLLACDRPIDARDRMIISLLLRYGSDPHHVNLDERNAMDILKRRNSDEDVRTIFGDNGPNASYRPNYDRIFGRIVTVGI